MNAHLYHVHLFLASLLRWLRPRPPKPVPVTVTAPVRQRASLLLLSACTGVGVMLAPAVQAQVGETKSANELVKVQVLADRDEVRSGEIAHIAVVFDIEAPWHIYWKNPGVGAAAPHIEITGPKSAEIGEIRWPRPKKITSPVGDMYCYEGRAVLFVPVRVHSTSSQPTAAMFNVRVDYAVCDDRICLMGDHRARVQMTVLAAPSGDPAATRPSIAPGSDRSAHAQLRAELRQRMERLPVQLTHDAAHNEKHKSEVKLQGRTLLMTIPAHKQSQATFFPGGIDGIKFDDVQMTFDAEKDVLQVEAQVTINRNNIFDRNPKITALVALGTDLTGPSYELTLPLPSD